MLTPKEGWLFPTEHALAEQPGLAEGLHQARSVTDKPARHHELTKRVHARNRMACRKFTEPLDPIVKENISTDEQRPGSCLDQAREGGVDFSVGACFQYLHL